MPQVALLLPTSVKTCRELLRGILQFVHLHGPWAVHIIEGRAGEQKLRSPAAWGCTGIILTAAGCRRKGWMLDNVPTVIVDPTDEMLNPSHPFNRLSYVTCDNRPIGRYAADFFLSRKFSNYAFVGEVNGASWSMDRLSTYSDRLAREGFSCSVYPPLSAAARKDFGVEQAALCDWLKALPKPVAIFVANDVRARQVLDSCLKAGVAVPQEAAVMGVDNDEMLCETTNPQMSSIQMNTEQIGFETARVLDSMMRSRQRPAKRVVLMYGLSNLVTRRSTETVQIGDAIIARALEFIRINAGIGVTVNDLVHHLHVSRRSLETRFKGTLGRTVYAEIMRVRLERVQTLLRETSMTVEAISDTCGFASASHLGAVFRNHFDMSLSSYRRRMRASTGREER